MAAFNKFNDFVKFLGTASINFSSDTMKVMLTNTVPVATNSVYGDISATEVANGNGYTTGGGAAALTSWTQTSGTAKLVLVDVAFTASGAVGPFRYAVLYDVTTLKLIGWWDYASALTLANGDVFTVDFDPTTGVLTIA